MSTAFQHADSKQFRFDCHTAGPSQREQAVEASAADNRYSTLVMRVFAPTLRWWERRLAIRALEALSDHYLKDVGIERTEIPSFVDEGRKSNEIFR